MIKAVIFDCFGVIITDALRALLSELADTEPTKVVQIRDIIHANNRGMIEPAESNRLIGELLGISAEAFSDRIHRGEAKDEAVLAFIKQLKTQYKTGLLTNIGDVSLRHRFSNHELRSHFNEVVTSGSVGMVKPDLEIYRLAADRLQVTPNDCVFIDDIASYADAAVMVGMQAITYTDLASCKAALRGLGVIVARD